MNLVQLWPVQICLILAIFQWMLLLHQFSLDKPFQKFQPHIDPIEQPLDLIDALQRNDGKPNCNLVLIVGLRGSATKWMSRVVEVVLKNSGKVVRQYEEPLNETHYNQISSSNWISVVRHATKNERLLGLGEPVVLSSYRDLRDVYASFKRRQIQIDMQNITQFMMDYTAWRAYSDYNMKFEDLLADPCSEIFFISRVLSRKISGQKDISKVPQAILEKYLSFVHARALNLSTLSPRNNSVLSQQRTCTTSQTPVTTFKGTLNDADLALIEERFGFFLLKNGYPLHNHYSDEYLQKNSWRKLKPTASF